MLWQIPKASPDLNPAEKYWAWLRKQMRAKDLADLHAKRAPVTKAGLKVRVRALCRSAKGKEVAVNCFQSLRKTCQEVKENGGIATKG